MLTPGEPPWELENPVSRSLMHTAGKLALALGWALIRAPPMWTPPCAAWASSQGGGHAPRTSIPKEPGGNYGTLYDLASKVTQTQCHPNSEGGNADPRLSRRGRSKSCSQKATWDGLHTGANLFGNCNLSPILTSYLITNEEEETTMFGPIYLRLSEQGRGGTSADVEDGGNCA